MVNVVNVVRGAVHVIMLVYRCIAWEGTGRCKCLLVRIGESKVWVWWCGVLDVPRACDEQHPVRVLHDAACCVLCVL